MGAIAVIPARGGSKRIPRKNIKPFLGTPMLARTIGILSAAGVFDRVMVSTDDAEIAAVATAAGAEVPFMRPAELSGDHVATLPVMQHAIRELRKLWPPFDYVCCAYPAAVLTRAADLRAAFAMLRESALDYVFSATSFPFPIQRALRKDAAGRCAMFWPEHAQTRSQDLEPAFHDAGQFYFARAVSWLEGRPVFGSGSAMLELPRHRVQDIDTLEDWQRAEMIFQLLSEDGADD